MHTLSYTFNRDQYITITNHALSFKLNDLKKTYIQWPIKT
jgi:hypothetical protein